MTTEEKKEIIDYIKEKIQQIADGCSEDIFDEENNKIGTKTTPSNIHLKKLIEIL